MNTFSKLCYFFLKKKNLYGNFHLCAFFVVFFNWAGMLFGYFISPLFIIESSKEQYSVNWFLLLFFHCIGSSLAGLCQKKLALKYYLEEDDFLPIKVLHRLNCRFKPKKIWFHLSPEFWCNLQIVEDAIFLNNLIYFLNVDYWSWCFLFS